MQIADKLFAIYNPLQSGTRRYKVDYKWGKYGKICAPFFAAGPRNLRMLRSVFARTAQLNININFIKKNNIIFKIILSSDSQLMYNGESQIEIMRARQKVSRRN